MVGTISQQGLSCLQDQKCCTTAKLLSLEADVTNGTGRLGNAGGYMESSVPMFGADS